MLRSTFNPGLTIIKTLALSKLIYNASVLNPPKGFAKKVNGKTFRLVWNFKADKLKRITLIHPFKSGGLNMVDFEMVEISLEAA